MLPRQVAALFLNSFNIPSRFSMRPGVLEQKLSRDSQLLLENLRAGRYRVEARAFSMIGWRQHRWCSSSQLHARRFPGLHCAFGFADAGAGRRLVGLSPESPYGGRTNAPALRSGESTTGRNPLAACQRNRDRTPPHRPRPARPDAGRFAAFDDDERPVVRSQPPRGRRALSRFRQEVENISSEIRRICEDLSPSALAAMSGWRRRWSGP